MDLLVALEEEAEESMLEVRDGLSGEWRERSSMKFPAARLLGVRGRCR